MTSITRDIHCVTKWSKFDTTWEGVIDRRPPGRRRHRAADRRTCSPTPSTATRPTCRRRISSAAARWSPSRYDGKPIPPDHGGPARLLVPHLYFWKSAKWVNALQFTERDEAGFWELRGYHMYGDPWQEQRYSGD